METRLALLLSSCSIVTLVSCRRTVGGEPMISTLLIACVLSFLTVATHATGIAVPIRSLVRHPPPTTSVWLVLRMLLRMIWWLVLLHLVEIASGVLLSVARMSAQRRSGVLLLRCHLHDRWIWRRGAGRAVANARTDREFDRRPHVRLVHGTLLRSHEPHPSIAPRVIHTQVAAFPHSPYDEA